MEKGINKYGMEVDLDNQCMQTDQAKRNMCV